MVASATVHLAHVQGIYQCSQPAFQWWDSFIAGITAWDSCMQNQLGVPLSSLNYVHRIGFPMQISVSL